MRTLRRLLFDHPQEALFFLFIGAFALVIGVTYWFASYEPAGTVLMLLFAVATGILGVRLAIDPRAALARRRATERRAGGEGSGPDPGDRKDLGGRGESAEGTGGIDRPFLDETGRLPGESFAPLAVGLGIALGATGFIFGLAPIAVGVLPLAWGAWKWLSGARDELAATERHGAGDAPTPSRGARLLQDDRGPRPEPPSAPGV